MPGRSPLVTWRRRFGAMMEEMVSGHGDIVAAVVNIGHCTERSPSMLNSHGPLPATAVGLVALRGYAEVMKPNRLPNRLRPDSFGSYRIPYVRTFAFLALMVILLVLAALGRAAPPIIDRTPSAIGFSSTNLPTPARAP